MSNENGISALLKNRAPIVGVAAAIVALLVLLLWPAPSSEPGLQNARDTAAVDQSVMAGRDDHAGHNHQSMEDSERMMSPDPHAGHRAGLTQEAEVWSCSMHPQIQRDGPGQCPICGMDLIPVRKDSSSNHQPDRSLTVSPAQRALMKIATVPVERRFPTAELRLVGKITYDETRLAYITAWVPGRIDDLLVDYTGVTVQEGDHMVELYSPELLSAQEELIQAVRGLADLSKSNLQSLRNSARGTVESARDKLRRWGLTAEQIAAVERSGKASEIVTIYSPASGVVIHRNAQEGMYVDIGTRIFTIADLDAVWVQLDAYESDLQWLRYGQPVSFTTEAFPGETFQGLVSFIDPVLDPQTRTVKVRVNVNNKDGRLKPEMFVRATVLAQFARGGKMIEKSLIGKWVSPMHPEIIKDKPGQCDICGMDLVPAESLGYSNTADSSAPLVIPATAPLLTGTRAVVYVEDQSSNRPTYVGKEVVLGPRAGPDYVVESGLSEGDLVVVSGNFKIDSALQIQAKPSMMNPDGGGSGGGHDHGAP
jgi:membrane fusion protein, copper/silver efflux system